MSTVDDEYKEEIARLPDEEVQRIAAAGTDDYRHEAIAFARTVLRQRGLTPPRETVHTSPRPQTKRFTLKLLILCIAFFLAALGLNVALRAYFRTHSVRPNIIFPVVALGWWALAYWEWTTLRKSANPSAAQRIRAFGNLAIAVLISVIALSSLAGTAQQP